VQVVTKRGDYTEVDVKRYVRIEKIPGGELSECIVLDGVMFNKVRTLRLTCLTVLLLLLLGAHA
jgi:hypothetical protein